jgi:hypothetical protein
VNTNLRQVFAKLGVSDQVALAPWYITRSSDVFTAGRQHNRWQAASGNVGNPTWPPFHNPSSYAHNFAT